MNDKVEVFYSDQYTSDQLSQLEEFCKSSGREEKHASSVNMVFEGWEQNTASLLYLFLKEKRFTIARGGLCCLYADGKIIAVSGFYRSDFHPEIFLFGVRSWVLKEHRLNLLIAEKLLPIHLEQIKKHRGKIAVLSFNESTRAFMKLIERSNQDKTQKKKFFFGDRYPELYHDMKAYPKPVKIKNSKQWILIKELEPLNFDWSTLEYNDKENSSL